MNHESMQTFLAIIRTGSISGAASALFTSQSTISQRLQLMEEELGIPLVTRAKGQKRIEVTPQGEKLIPIAEQWLELHHSAMHLRDIKDRSRLSVGAIEAINTHTLPNFYYDYTQTHPAAELIIRSNQYWEIYELMERNELDIGIVNNNTLRANSDLIIEPLFSEEYVVLRSLHWSSPSFRIGRTIHPRELDGSNEIYQLYDVDFQQWHDKWWPTDHYSVTVYNESLLGTFLQEEDKWAIVPLSVAKSLSQTMDLAWVPLSDPPPKRSYYLMTRKYMTTRKDDEVQSFIRELHQFIAMQAFTFSTSN